MSASRGSSPRTRPAHWRRRPRDGDRAESGAGAIGLLAVLVVLGFMAVIVLAETNATSRRSATTSSPTVNSSPAQADNDVASADRALCLADYAAVEEAAAEYDGLHVEPSNMTEIDSMLKDPVTSPYFTIGIGPGGAVTVAAGGHAATPGSANCAHAG